VSFDIFLQRFVAGEAADGAGQAILAILEPAVVERSGSWARVVTSDGGAEVQGMETLESGLMVSHAAGRAVWDLLFELASAGRMGVMPTGCPSCAVDPSLIDELPPSVPAGKLVTSGADILAVVERS